MKQVILFLLLVASVNCTAGEINTTQPFLAFTENKGQVTDQFQHQRKDIDFRLEAGGGLNIYIGNGEIHYQFSRTVQNSGAGRNEGIAEDMYRMDVELVGADKNAEPVKEDEQGYREYYYTGGNEMEVHSFGRIIYKNIYPAVDWVLYVRDGQLKHEFVVRPGGNVADIKLKYSGATSLKLNADGSLAAATPQGIITEQTPLSYQKDGKIIESAFSLDGDVISYTTAGYSGTLVIDPVLSWATYYGGAGQELGNNVSIDALGFIYIAGSTTSTNAIATTGTHQFTRAGTGFVHDAFLAKFSSQGVRIWGTYYGSTSDDYLQGMAADSFGYVYITGYTPATSGMSVNALHQSTYGGGVSDAFLARFDSSGKLKWSTYFGGNDEDQSSGGLAINDSGHVYICGYTKSPAGIASVGAHDGTFTGAQNTVFLAKFDSTGVRKWGTYYGANFFDQGERVAVDDSGNVFIAGTTNSTSGIATTGAHQTSHSGNYDAFLAKFNNAGVLKWGTYYGAGDNDIGQCVATDTAGNVYLAGYSNSTTGIATSGTHRPGKSGYFDVFLVKFNRNGTRQWGTYMGGAGLESAEGGGLVTDYAGNIYLSGITYSDTGISTPGAHQVTIGSTTDHDAFLAKFGSNGKRKWGTYYGGADTDNGRGLATDKKGKIFLFGFTRNTSGIATSGTYQTVHGTGGEDAFLAAFCDIEVDSISGGDTVCTGDTVRLSNTTPGGAWSTLQGKATVSAQGVVTGVSAGIDTVRYIVTNNCTSDTAFAKVTVLPVVVPSVTISASPDTNICAGTFVTFTATPTNGGATPGYQWQINGTDVTGAIQNPFNGTGLLNNDVITVVLTSAAECPIPEKDTSNVITMHVAPVTSPTVSISANPGTTIPQGTMVTFTATASNIGTSTQYQWKINGANVGGQVTSSYMTNTLADNDLVSVVVYSNDSCSNPDTALSNVLDMTVTVSIAALNKESGISVYPNPTNGMVVITGSTVINNVTVTNIVGQKLISREGNSKTMTIDLEGLAPGVYIIKVNDSYVERVVKE